MATFTGVFPIIPTIFTGNGSVDRDGMQRVVEYILDAGAAGVVFPGLASEYDMLTCAERLDITAWLGAGLQGRATFIVGGSASTVEQAARYVRAGADAGAAAAMVMTPRDLAHDMSAMEDFYRSLGEQAGIPLMLQNAPAPMGIGMSVDAVARLTTRVEQVRFVKEETMPSGQRISALSEQAGQSLDAVFGGAGGRYVIDELSRGARGTMPACEITEVHVAMLAAFARGDEETARDLFERTLPLLSMQAIFRWRLTKEVLRRRGLIESTLVRAPGPTLDPHDLRELDALLERIGDLLTVARPSEQAIAA